jgi:hypothetical protein
LFERGDEGAHVLAPALQVEHDVGDPLARPMIGVFAAASGREDREAVGVDQVFDTGAGAGGVKRRVLDQPDQLGCGTGADRLGTCFHQGKRIGVAGQAGLDAPFDRC